jgi:hypothetical protein
VAVLFGAIGDLLAALAQSPSMSTRPTCCRRW